MTRQLGWLKLSTPITLFYFYQVHVKNILLTSQCHGAPKYLSIDGLEKH